VPPPRCRVARSSLLNQPARMPVKPSVASLVLIALAKVGAGALLLGLLSAWIFGAVWGGIVAAIAVFAVVGYYAYKLAQLAHWLDDAKAATLPEGIGLWGETLGALYRMIRTQRAEQKNMADTLSRFQQAADVLPDGAVMLDERYNIVWCNPSAEQHLGLSLTRDRMQTITYLIRTPEFIGYLDQRNFNAPLTLRFSHHAPTTARAGDRTLSVQLVPFGDDQMLLLSQDISERERLETMRRDFVANVSHELRTPLTVVSGFLETVTMAGANNTALVEKSIAHMTTQTTRMQRLVEDLLTLSRLEDVRNRPPLAPVNVPELVRAMVHDATLLSNGRHTIEPTIDDVWLLGARDEIASAFSNLINNAVYYTPAGGTIRVAWQSLAKETGGAVFRVIDNGEGIAPEHLPRLTERFYRVDRGRSRASGGTGLGLAIVKHVLLRHEATLDIASVQDAADHGSTFTATFGAARICPATPKPQSVAA
jgi:two-component system, OmpR family, phosphate regulon sensor histidine kinase PhoR